MSALMQFIIADDLQCLCGYLACVAYSVVSAELQIASWDTSISVLAEQILRIACKLRSGPLV